jgi:hypothetical protein
VTGAERENAKYELAWGEGEVSWALETFTKSENCMETSSLHYKMKKLTVFFLSPFQVEDDYHHSRTI